MLVPSHSMVPSISPTRVASSSPSSQPSSQPTSEAFAACRDTPTWLGSLRNGNEFSCSQITEDNRDRRCPAEDTDGVTGTDACPLACGLCTVAPSGSPSSTPTSDASPVPSSVPSSDPTSQFQALCIDSTTWEGNGRNGSTFSCSQINDSNRDRRCPAESSDGMSGYDACPVACQQCT